MLTVWGKQPQNEKLSKPAGLAQGLRVFALLAGLGGAGALAADQPPEKFAKPIEQGQHVLIFGNSFQNFAGYHLGVMAESAGIKRHIRRGDPLSATKVDVVACNPWFIVHDKPDKNLDDLTERGLKHNPNIRI